MKLYSWKPDGHGQKSFYVVAESYNEAIVAVSSYITSHLGKFDKEYLTNYCIDGWGTDYYKLTVVDPLNVITNDKMKKQTLMAEELEMLWIGAFRYYLGRMTISTHSFCDALMENWLEIPKRAQIVIKRDLEEEINRDDMDRKAERDHCALGHDCDSQKWREVFVVIDQ